MPDKHITLSQLQQRITRTLMADDTLANVWVLAELSDVRTSGGHCYLELVEKSERGEPLAKMRAMIWRNLYGPLNEKFMRATGSPVRSGFRMLLRGTVSHHGVYGISFVVSDIDPSYTIGETERIRREIIARLTREGVAEQNRRLKPPFTPQRVAVISAGGAAGYGDFVNQLATNSRGYVFYTMLFPAVMQGTRTAPTVLRMLDLVERTLPMAKWDCVAIMRGGGATSDLTSFDDYALARRVATFPIPVVVGIGHERDMTVLDYLANTRCKTPTAVAAWLTGQLDAAYEFATSRCRTIGRYTAEALKGEHLRMRHMESALPAAVRARTQSARMQLQGRASRLGTILASRSSAEHSRLAGYPPRLTAATAAALRDARARLTRLGDMLRVLSPDNTLRRGYSITRLNGRALTSADDVRPGDTLTTTLLDGTLTSTVSKDS